MRVLRLLPFPTRGRSVLSLPERRLTLLLRDHRGLLYLRRSGPLSGGGWSRSQPENLRATRPTHGRPSAPTPPGGRLRQPMSLAPFRMRHLLTEVISTTGRQAIGSAYRRPSSVHQDPRAERRRTCAHCGWSWAAGSEGSLLCLNPEAPHGYDVVPAHLTCPEHDPNPAQA